MSRREQLTHTSFQWDQFKISFLSVWLLDQCKFVSIIQQSFFKSFVGDDDVMHSFRRWISL